MESKEVVVRIVCPADAVIPAIFTGVARAATTEDPSNPAALLEEMVELMDASVVGDSSGSGSRWHANAAGGIPIVCKPVLATADDDEKDAIIARLKAENARLRAELATAQAKTAAKVRLCGCDGDGDAHPNTHEQGGRER